MTTILIWLGSGFAFAVGVGFGAWMNGLRGKQLSDAEQARFGIANDLLRERNSIGERQAKSLETLAQWADQNWKLK